MERERAAARADKAAITYLIAFTVAAFTLLAFARAGAPSVLVQAVLLAFVAVATLWVRAQYVDGLDGKQWVIPGNWTVALLVASAGLFLSWRLRRLDGLLLGALYVLWLGGSAVVTRMRDVDARGDDGLLARFFGWTATRRGRLGCALTLIGVSMLSAGVLLLGRGSTMLLGISGGLLATGLVLILPVGISLLSESALRTLEDDSRAFFRPQGGWLARGWAWAEKRLPQPRRVQFVRAWRLFVTAAQPLPLVLFGGTLFVALAVACAVLADTWWVLLAFGVLLAIVIALVSSTHADVVIVMAAVALLGVTPHQQPPPKLLTGSASVDGLNTLVAIGDSYMSGEGASVYYEGTDDGGGNQCRRAPTAWAALAADAGFAALEFLACSGSRTGNVLYDPQAASAETAIPASEGARAFRDALAAKHVVGAQQGGDASTQLDMWRIDQRARGLIPTLVVVSVGGNDAGFSTIGQMCLAPGSCSDRDYLWTGALDQVRAQLRLAYMEIDETFPGVPIVTAAYPDPISLETKKCGQVSLTLRERRFIHDFLTGTSDRDGLNDVVSETSQEFGFYHVASMETALADVNLQLCDDLNDGRPGLNFIGLRSVRGAAEQRFNPANWLHSSLHPNERGHAALLRAFQTWRAGQPQPLPARTSITPAAAKRLQEAENTWAGNPTAQAAKTVQQAGQCDLFDNTQSGCRPQGSNWALGQVRNMLWGAGLWLGLAAVAAAWTAAIGFFGGRRRRWTNKTP